MLYCENINCLEPFILDESLTKCPHCSGSKLSSYFHQRYQVISHLDSGGFGKVYLAIDTKNNHAECVIKQINTRNYKSVQIKKIKELFAREVNQLKRLNHPQIPKFFESFTENERLYLVQEYILGNNLAIESVEKGFFSEQKIIELLVSILPVLHFIHQKKVIHRDIKPENIIRRVNNQDLVLVDFGSSKNIISSCTALNQATIIGAPQYIAPEQAKGKPRYSSDLYSLGFTCLYLITGLNLFDLYDITENKCKWHDYLGNNKISKKLGYILDKLIEDNYQNRYQSVEEVWQDLQTISRQAQKIKLEKLSQPETTEKSKSPEIEKQKSRPNNLSKNLNLQEISGIILSRTNKKELVAIAKNSVPLLEIKFNGTTIGSSSSFLYKQIIDSERNLSKCYFLTNLHIISTILDWIKLLNDKKEKNGNLVDNKLEITANWQQKEFKIKQFIIPKNTLIELEKGNQEVIHLDFAAFCLEISSTERLSFFGIAEKSALEIGDKIYAFGYPESLNFSMTHGIVGQIYSETKQDSTLTVNQWAIQHNMLINHGNSGGPTITEYGELIGISTRVINSFVEVGIKFSLDIHQIINYMSKVDNMQILDIDQYSQNLKNLFVS